MKRSSSRILTTHTGSLPRPADLVELLNDKELGEPYDAAAYAGRIRSAISDIVARQAAAGLDVVNDGEHSKVNWMAYARARLAGLEEIDSPVRFRGPTRDSMAFKAAYEDMRVDARGPVRCDCREAQVRPRAYVCSGPIKYVGQGSVAVTRPYWLTASCAAKAGSDEIESSVHTVASTDRVSRTRSSRSLGSLWHGRIERQIADLPCNVFQTRAWESAHRATSVITPPANVRRRR